MGNSEKTRKPNNRLHLLDTIRGFAIVGMIFIHISYDLPSYFNIYPGYLRMTWYDVFCQFVRITFIFLSGYCAFLGKHTLKRGLIVSGVGLGITLVTLIGKFDDPIIFGVLTLIGASMLLSVPLRHVIKKKNALFIFVMSMLLFLVTLHIHDGYCGILEYSFFEYPKFLYRAGHPLLLYPLAFLGLPGHGFVSSDYFPLMPWFFLFLSGSSFYVLCGEKLKSEKIMKLRLEPLAFMGRFSLYIYVLHQPLIMGIMMLLEKLK